MNLLRALVNNKFIMLNFIVTFNTTLCMSNKFQGLLKS